MKNVIILVLIFCLSCTGARKDRVVEQKNSFSEGSPELLKIRVPSVMETRTYSFDEVDTTCDSRFCQLMKSYDQYYKANYPFEKSIDAQSVKSTNRSLRLALNNKAIDYSNPRLVKEFSIGDFTFCIIKDSLTDLDIYDEDVPGMVERIDLISLDKNQKIIDVINISYQFTGNYWSETKLFYINRNKIYLKVFVEDEAKIEAKTEEQWGIMLNGTFAPL